MKAFLILSLVRALDKETLYPHYFNLVDGIFTRTRRYPARCCGNLYRCTEGGDSWRDNLYLHRANLSGVKRLP